jgi:perosamine synthetase
LPLRVLKENCAEIESSYWLNVVILDKVVDVVALTIALQDAEIETRPLFSPVESFPYFSETADCKVSKTMHKRGICLPSFPDLTNSELNKICQIIRGYYAN